MEGHCGNCIGGCFVSASSDSLLAAGGDVSQIGAFECQSGKRGTHDGICIGVLLVGWGEKGRRALD